MYLVDRMNLSLFWFVKNMFFLWFTTYYDKKRIYFKDFLFKCFSIFFSPSFIYFWPLGLKARWMPKFLRRIENNMTTLWVTEFSFIKTIYSSGRWQHLRQFIQLFTSILCCFSWLKKWLLKIKNLRAWKLINDKIFQN